jgi:hypothetical protein
MAHNFARPECSEVGMSERTFSTIVILIGAVAIACMALALYK